MPLLIDKTEWEAADMQILFNALDVLLNLVPPEQLLRIWLRVLRAMDKGTVVQEGEGISSTGLLADFIKDVVRRVFV